QIRISLPTERIADILKPNKVNISYRENELEKAVKNPVNSPDIENFLGNTRKILIIVNDTTRPTPTALILDCIFPFIKDREITILVATGIHEPTSDEQNKIILGKYYNLFSQRLICHNSKRSRMRDIGYSKNNTHLLINELVFEYEKIIVTGSVEPHYFAGYTGGRKAFMPGVAAYESIEQNHMFAMRPKSRLLALDGNPVHDDMVDALNVVKNHCKIFSIMTVLDEKHSIYAAAAGCLEGAFKTAVSRCQDVYCVKCRDKADVVVAICTYPMDANLYQSQKALESGKLILKKNGIIILVSQCGHGIGEGEFANILRSSSCAHEIIDKFESNYILGAHKAVRIAELSTWANIWCVTNLPGNDLHGLFMTPKQNLQRTVDEALHKSGNHAKVSFLFSASTTVPLIG
ncbi:MAG: nickel-dependent lactate racemase, partial [bacterium]